MSAPLPCVTDRRFVPAAMVTHMSVSVPSTSMEDLLNLSERVFLRLVSY